MPRDFRCLLDGICPADEACDAGYDVETICMVMPSTMGLLLRKIARGFVVTL